ncbi:MAG TPA: serine acetyltransferase [Gammaproteobacteria bacterium]
MDALAIYRLANWCYRHHIPLIPSFLQGVIFFLFSSYIPYQATIGAGTKIGHRGIGVVINRDVVIGRNVLIRAHVTIGKKTSAGRAPRIEDNVEIGDGAKILGDLVVGSDAIIGANAVVVKDVPSGALALGVPARIVERNP